MRYLWAFIGSGAAMAVLDAIWLTQVGPRLYRPAIGELLADKPDMRAAVAFYLIYVCGIVFIAVSPALRDGSLLRATTMGAALGFVAYATYDLTNQATLKVWPLHVTLIDVAWGTVLTAAAAAAGHWLAARFG
ncbi:DUF2177 family protein [Brevundimonas viscosa]|uniref:Uncharacterized membrane protein n=1 Tax=Brevundimonas viscosa TaxID=871741 RepID=A0A1I6TBK1_9CAUL|nr:DUF2177 family protein [Brevundimonas viscosa]SFS86589.1 Uncharacterized membrane protein [Brevundimonas viscosa]